MRQRVSHTRSWLQEMEALLGGAGALAPQARLMQRQRDAVKLQLRTMLDTVAAFHTHVLVRASSQAIVGVGRRVRAAARWKGVQQVLCDPAL